MSPRNPPRKNFSKAQILGKGSDSCEAGEDPRRVAAEPASFLELHKKDRFAWF